MLRCCFQCGALARQVKRQKAISISRKNVVRLLNELELSPNTSFEREVVSDGEMVSLTVQNMDALKQYNDEVYFHCTFCIRNLFCVQLFIYIMQLQRCILVKLECVQCVVKNLS